MITALIAIAASAVTAFATWRLCRAGRVLDAILRDALGPDPAEVDELAHVIRLALYPPSDDIGLRPSESDRTAASAALRWMRGREAKP